MNTGRLTAASNRYRSGAIEIDALQRQVSIDNAPGKVGARAFDVLLTLVERRERVVSKHELMDLVWPNLVVEENNLLVHIVALRKLLGPRAIATIPGRGYRFALPVDTISGGPADSAQCLVTRGNLAASPLLFGREHDLHAVDRLLREHMVASIVGAAGIGKTRLALAAAVSCRLELPDGCWWVELAPINDGTQVPSSIAGVLGIQLAAGRSPQEALAVALASKKLLLVLDNCEHLADDIAGLIELLRARAQNARLLVTSQESLKCRDEHVYRLGALAIPASAQLEDAARFGAVALFVDRAHSADSRFRLAADNVGVVVDICRRLDGIPLAIELAAARVPLLGVHGLHARLNQIFNVLSGGARMKLRRHQTLRAALDWSHELLSADEQAVFRRLGVFAGGFTLELAQEIISHQQVDPWLVLDSLGHLVDKSLVVADGEGEPRYRLLETTRAFALEKLAAAGESEAMLRRHAQVMRELMTAIDANRWTLSASERKSVIHELGNVRAALDWALASADDRKLAYELMSKCWLVWILNGLASEGVQRMLQLWPPPTNLSASIEADFCLALARLNESSGHDAPWQAALRARTLYREYDDSDRLGDALLLVATIGAARNQSVDAEEALRDADDLVDARAALRKQAALAEARGQCYLRRGAFDFAIAAFRRQAELSQSAGAVRREYQAFGNVGSAQLAAGEVDAAIDSLRKSVHGLRTIVPTYGLEVHLGTLAVAVAWRGDDFDVLPLAREAFDHHHLLGTTFVPLMAAALQHARSANARRAVVVAGYAHAQLRPRQPPGLVALPMLQRVRDCAMALHSAALVEAWLREGERLTEEQAAAIAFDEGSADLPAEGDGAAGLQEERHENGPMACRKHAVVDSTG
jgi:predicted ATPase/DNA-binding winged helix-turn-helix (wHTH) protein